MTAEEELDAVQLPRCGRRSSGGIGASGSRFASWSRRQFRRAERRIPALETLSLQDG
jgi:hypothetical protein